MANIFANGEIPELEVIAYEKEDTDKIDFTQIGLFVVQLSHG